jgi:hypothetical protein
MSFPPEQDIRVSKPSVPNPNYIHRASGAPEMPCSPVEAPQARRGVTRLTARREGAPHAAGAVAQDVSVDHRRRDVAVTEELLHGADVVDALEKCVAKECRKV